MRHLTTSAVCRVLTVLALVAGGLWAPSLATAGTTAPLSDALQGPAPQSPAPQSYAGPCTDDLGVTVVVDFQALGGSTVVRCAPGSGGAPFQGSGLDAFQAAGIQIAGTSQHGLSVVCRVNGRPAADEELSIPGDDGYTEQCAQMPPAAAFWSYWQADNNGSWTFSQLGVASSTARAGGFEALSFALNSTSGTPPRTAPSRPAPEPSPTPEPEPTPAPEPEPTPPPEPEPEPEPTPAPQPTPPPSEDPTPSPAPVPAPTGPESSAPGEPTPSDAAPSPEPGEDPTTESTTGTDETASGTTASEPPTGDDTTATTGPETAADDATADDDAETSAPTETSADPTSTVSGDQFTDPADDGGGAGALWVTVGILLLLGGLAFLASRRRRDPDITHQVEP